MKEITVTKDVIATIVAWMKGMVKVTEKPFGGTTEMPMPCIIIHNRNTLRITNNPTIEEVEVK